MTNQAQTTEIENAGKLGRVRDSIKQQGGRTMEAFFLAPDALHIKEGFNVRTNNADYSDRVLQLAADIKANGVKTPLSIYRDVDDKFYIVNGHTRYLAVKHLIASGVEIAALPVIIDSAKNEVERTIALISTNNGRDLSPLEKAEVFARLQKFGFSQGDIAAKCGVTVGYVSQLLSLADAPEEIKDAVRADEISAANAQKLIRDQGPVAATKTLKTALDVAAQAGKTKVTDATLRQVNVESTASRPAGKPITTEAITKVIASHAAPLYNALRGVMADSGFAALDAPLKTRINKLMEKIASGSVQPPEPIVRAADAVENAANAVAPSATVAVPGAVLTTGDAPVAANTDPYLEGIMKRIGSDANASDEPPVVTADEIASLMSGSDNATDEAESTGDAVTITTGDVSTFDADEYARQAILAAGGSITDADGDDEGEGEGEPPVVSADDMAALISEGSAEPVTIAAGDAGQDAQA